MRLTLRTLLAYMDSILDPPDQEELAQRIAASDVATDLLHRTQETSRRLRLPPPEVDATGPYSDPNTVAEYLDNAMAPDNVSEFERRCLDLQAFDDADSHLAEVATCHHVLTMVLAQRAEIDSTTKTRLYDMAREGGPRAVDATPVRPSAGPALHEEAQVSQVPDYLKASETSLLSRLLPAIAALLLLAVTATFALGPGGWLTANNDPAQEDPLPADASTSLVDDAIGEMPEAAPHDTLDDTPASPPEPPSFPPIDSPLPAPAETEPPVAQEEIPTTPEPTGLPAELLGEDPNPPAEDEPPALPSPVIESPAEPPSPLDTLADPASQPLAGLVDDPLPSEVPEPNSLVTDSPSEASGEEPTPGAPLSEDSVADAPDENDAVPEIDPPVPPVTPERVGLVFTPTEVLLRLDSGSEEWRRLGMRAEVKPGDHLLSLPTYRPTLAFDNEVSLDLFGATAVDVGYADADTPSLELVYGKLLLTNTSTQPKELSLTIGDHTGRLTLGPDGAAVAVSAHRSFRPGIDPREVAAPLDAVFYTPLGEVTWRGDSFAQIAEGRVTWSQTSLGLSQPEVYADDPQWMLERQLSRVQRDASPRLAAQLQQGEPIWSQLSVISQSPRKDERALANLFAVEIGQFASTIRALRDEEQQLSWVEEIEALRAAMSSRPEMAQEVYEELTRQHRQELADGLWEMLQGYSLEQVGQTPEEWRVGAMRKLIDWLGSDQLDFRVLANYNLEQITGRRSVFNPIGTSGTREKSINRQRNRLESGDLRPAGLLP